MTLHVDMILIPKKWIEMNPGPSRKQLKYGALKCYADFLLGEKVPRFQDQDSHAIRNWL